MWVLYSFLAAFSDAARLAVTKKLTTQISSFQIIFLSSLLSFPILVACFWSYFDISLLNGKILSLIFFTVGLMYTLAFHCMNTALRISEFSIVMPLMTLSPIFLLFWEPLILGDSAGFFGIIGVMLSIFGAYFLHFNKRSIGFFEPLKHLFYDRGAQLAVLTSVILSFGPIFDKTIMKSISPQMYAMFFPFCGFIISFFLLLFTKKTLKKSQLNKKNIVTIIFMGIFMAGNTIFSLLPLQVALGAYVVSIKRFSAVFAILIAYFVFHEKVAFKERLFASALMVLGVIFISLD
ncbi:EamA family transporter [Candidatus Peregrinibacteria bacterium]|jgi:uncharacterized membrane protein|nr:EamA family transporter [Candidatus Peregrinibacteria bacterium]